MLYTVTGRLGKRLVTQYIKTSEAAYQLAQNWIEAGYARVRVDEVDFAKD